jgi:hypothetical protein
MENPARLLGVWSHATGRRNLSAGIKWSSSVGCDLRNGFVRSKPSLSSV